MSEQGEGGRSLLSAEMMARLGRLSLLVRRLPSALRRGRRVSRRAGGGPDVIDSRSYAAGDDPRQIAWPVYARLERLVVRLRADETPARVALVIDASGSMGHGEPSKLWQASCVAAGLGAAALAGEDRVAALATGQGGVTAVRASGGRRALGRLLTTLEGLRAGGVADLEASAVAATGALGGRGLCVIVSDFLHEQGALAGAKAARAQGHRVALIEVLDRSEIDPPDLGDADVEDEETGEIFTLPSDSRAAYVQALAAHRAELRAGAAELGAALLHVRTDEPFDDVVVGALRAGVLRAGGPS